MLQTIADFVDFDRKRINKNSIIEEFNHKYANSWLLINDKPALINKALFGEKGVILQATPLGKLTTNYTEEISLKPFSPETGLYGGNDGVIYLYRQPARQWTKGFAIGKNYQYKTLVKRDGLREIAPVKLITDKETVFNKETLVYLDKVYLHWQLVGEYNIYTGKIHLKNNRFLKELQELWPQYWITLDAVSPKRSTGERLILDF